MKSITTESEHESALEEVYNLMNKGSQNVTTEESEKIHEIALAIQAYEQKKYGLLPIENKDQ